MATIVRTHPKRRVVYFITSILYAIGYFYMTMVVWEVFSGDPLAVTLGNVILIFAFVALDKISDNQHAKLKEKHGKATPTPFTKFLLWYLDTASFKTSLYLFYFVAITANAIVNARPDFPVLYIFADYLSFIQYGILILMAGDGFLKQLAKDSDKMQSPN